MICAKYNYFPIEHEVYVIRQNVNYVFLAVNNMR